MHIARKLVDQQALAITVRISDEDFRGAGRFGGAYGHEHFIRHEMAKALVLETLRTELVSGDYSSMSTEIYTANGPTAGF